MFGEMANSWAERKLHALKSRDQDPEHDYVFWTSCVGSTGEDIDAMTDDDVQVEVTYAEMAAHCDLSQFEAEMGYGPDIGLELKNDTMVSFWRSMYRGVPCYFLDHSRIEYIWVRRDRTHAACLIGEEGG